MWGAGCVFGELLQMTAENIPNYRDRKPLFPGKSCFPLSPMLSANTDGEVATFHSGYFSINISRLPPYSRVTLIAMRNPNIVTSS